jgi:quercetin dioxygenase-like cupin family protein
MSVAGGPALMTGCRWVDPPVEEHGEGIETESLFRRLGFEVLRVFWLTNIAPGQWRGRHAHRQSILATFVTNGSCRLTLDNAKEKQVVELHEGGPGLVIGPWIWHDLYDFSPDAVILVAASTRYDEAEYIRDYEQFVREASALDHQDS